MNDILTWLLDAVQSVDPALRTALAGIAILLETSILIGLIVPGDTIVIVAGTGVDGVGQYIALYLVVVVGALTGESIGFALGKYFGHYVRRSRLGRRIGEHNWRRAENYLERRGGIAVFLSRFLPVLHSLIPVTVGMSPMTYKRFLAWTAPACLIWTAGYVSVGSAAAETYRDLANQLHFAGYIFVGIIAVFLVVAWAVKTALQRLEKRHMAHEERGGDPD
ncbi:membrane protein DedA, SNARE-associated domain [Paramicrobacterium humi]|uniref:Membrane protein DedA, SNARE-associated domain n=1 Tax=Paramicrobacterium humi TaxID=640635 RepID=A0A1H4QBF2_9MICO|nr:DedA family protein [Microbacterium humi]SEC16850.1 membrane protein DedA, SNARE-associated domain [Microbacterium humi]